MNLLTLAELAQLVIDRRGLPLGERREWTDRIRKRAVRDVSAGSLTRQSDGSFLLADAANWLRRTQWRGLPAPGSFDDLPGAAAFPLERLIIRKGKNKGKPRMTVRVRDQEATYVPVLPDTVETCHDEIRRLNKLLTRYYRQCALLADKVTLVEEREKRRAAAREREKSRRRVT